MFPDRKSRWLAIALFGAIAVFCLVPLYYVGDLARFQTDNALREGQAPLRDLKDPAQLEPLLRQYPSNRVLKLVALANRDATEIDAAALGLLRELDPGELSTRINKGLASRSGLDALGRDLKAAEDNAAGLGSRYETLIKPVREGIGHDADALGGGTKFMTLIDTQHAEMKALIARISAARLDYFRAYDTCVGLLAQGNDGAKGSSNGPITFRLQAQADSYNAAAAVTSAVAKRLTDLETERTALRQSQFERWKSWAGGWSSSQSKTTQTKRPAR
jgi:hypothetical protein